MNTLIFKMMNPTNDMWIYFDNKLLKPQKKYGHDIYNYKTNKDMVEIKIYKINEVSFKHYILFHIIFFLISVLGLFNKRYDKRCIEIKYAANIKLIESSTVVAKYIIDTNNPDAIELETDVCYEVIENTKQISVEAKKRLKRLRLISILIYLILFAILIAAIIFNNK